MIKASIHYFLLFFLPICATSQKADFQFFTTADGLSNNRIWNFTQDQQGFIWLSADGLNRFDGQHFLNYNNRPDSIFAKNNSLPNIHSIDSKLITLNSNNLLAFNTLSGETKVHFLTSFITDDAFVNPGQSIEIDEEYVIIPVFSKQKKEVALIKYQQGKLSKMATLQDVNANFELGILTICADRSGHIFYQDESLSKIIKIGTTGKKLAEIPLPKKKEVTLKSGYGNTVFGNVDNLFFELDESADSFRPHPINDQLDKLVNIAVYDFVQTPKGDLWVACDDRKLFFYEAETGQLLNYREQLKTIIPFQLTLNRIALDKTGVLWINTITGLLKVTPQRKWFDTYFTGQWDACEGQCSFRGFAENEEGAVFASFYSNVFKINPKEKTTSPPLYPSGITPFDLHFEEGKLLLNNGWVFNLESQQLSNPYSINIESYDGGIFASDEKNGLWMANRKKLFYLKESNSGAAWENVPVITDQGNFTDIKFDPHLGTMWLSTNNTLRAYHAVQGTAKLSSEHKWPEFLGIRYLHPDKNGRIWIASESGLLYFDPKIESLKKYTMEDGLPNNNVVTILPEGDSCLWLGTNFGLSRFSKTTETFINFYEEDGLAHNEFNRRSAFKTKNGQLFFGGIGGVTAFYPEEVMKEYWNERKSGKLSLTSFTKTDADLDTTFTTIFNGENPTIDIFHKNKTFQFEYALTDFRQPEKVSYSYQLEGYDNVWSKPSAANTATFNALPSGSYTFRVKAFNGRGQWHSEELQIKLVVHPPWWATWWAYLLYALAVAGVASGIFYFLKKRWDLQNSLLLEQAEAQRLKELDGFKSRLFTNLTHEFRTPLTVILGMAERGKVESGKLGNGITQDQLQTVSDFLVSNFKLIENNGQNLLRLVNQLLDLSKLEDKSFRLNLQQSDIVPYLRYVTESFQTFANSHNIALRFFTTLKELEMDFDPEQLKQVMTNLISNAIKFTPSGGEVEVSVGKGQFEAERKSRTCFGTAATKFKDQELETADWRLRTGDCLLITVKDTGIGISTDDLPHIFDRFYQVDGSTTRAGEGTGIGLAHSLELVKLMGGVITVESELGEGSVFYLSLPVGQSAVGSRQSSVRQFDSSAVLPQGNDQKSTDHKDWRSRSEFGTRSGELKTAELKTGELPNLLIIEDNPDVVFYLKTCLAELYQLDVALNGRIGIEKALETIPDLIISDVMMPEKNGYEVCETLKNDERTSHIPIVLLTAKADVASKITGLRRGADAYLAKPFDKEELLVRLEMLAELRKRLRERYASLQSAVGSPQTGQYTEFEMEDAFIQKIKMIVAEHYEDEGFTLPQLCQKVGMSRSQLFRKMKAIMNTSPSDFIRKYRLDKAKYLLENEEINVAEAAYQTGFKDPSYFSKLYQEEFGVAPSMSRK